MGYGFDVRCSKCGRKQQFQLGIGMMDCGFENFVERHFKGKRKTRILALVQEHEPAELHYGARLYSCPKCEVLHQRCCVGLEKGGTMLFETQFWCGRCRTVLVPTELDASHFRCWHCSEKTLVEMSPLCWD
ncbi:MAG: hypothetical protein IPH48_17680 [bacterium]|nr:hypothetical protein [bacterium]